MKITIEITVMKDESEVGKITSADILEEIGAIIAETPTKRLEAEELVWGGELANYKITVTK